MGSLENSFQVRINGKCILAGEHAVLRGCPALVLPVRGAYLNFVYDGGEQDLEIEVKGRQSEILDILIWGVLDRACATLNIERSFFRGKITIESNISIGAGMGASASLCVGLSKFLNFKNLIEEQEIYEFAKNLENIFHGESSGVDIAVALESRPIRFIRNQERSSLGSNWSPKLFLTYSGQKGITSECVEMVKQLWTTDSEFAKSIDLEMKDSVDLMEKSLVEGEEKGSENLKIALDKALSCFHKWGLVSTSLKSKMEEIQELGAIAVKPTGSGNGGYILSFWQQDPPLDSGLDFIPVG